MTQPYIGQIMIFGFNFAPRDYAFCNGQLTSIAQNTALFSILGTTYGGDGQTTFALPNLQEKGIMNIGQGTGLSNYALGQVSGVTSVQLQTTQIPAHNHTAYASPGTTLSLTPSANGWFGTSAPPWKIFSDVTPPTSAFQPGTLQPSGGNQPHSNEQPYLVMNFCIALFGIFPTRN